MAQIRWTGAPRALAHPQQEVEKGEVVEVDDDAAASLVEQGHAEAVPTKKESN
jgi:hypothetical protein